MSNYTESDWKEEKFCWETTEKEESLSKKHEFNESIKNFREISWIRSIYFHDEIATSSGHSYQWMLIDDVGDRYVATIEVNREWKCGRMLGANEIDILEKYYKYHHGY